MVWYITELFHSPIPNVKRNRRPEFRKTGRERIGEGIVGRKRLGESKSLRKEGVVCADNRYVERNYRGRGVCKYWSRENVSKQLFGARSLIDARELSYSRLEECYNRPLLGLRSDPQWRSAIVIWLVRIDIAPCE